MQDRIYLLSIADFLEETGGEVLIREALSKVDESRTRKAVRIRQPRARAACLGAGLLLQVAVQDFLKANAGVRRTDCIRQETGQSMVSTGKRNYSTGCYTVRELLAQIKSPLRLEFVYGKSGKPYLKEYPFYFNLSHSGDYVVCAISEQEIGVDIQEHRSGTPERIAERYFTAGEIKVLEQCDTGQKEKVFFDLWAAKEAYGKYTGGGITESLEQEIPASQVAMQLIHSIPGYSLALCKSAE